MNKTDLIREVILRINGRNPHDGKASEELPLCMGREFVDTLLSVVTDEMKKNGKVVMSGFGTLYVRDQKARSGVNPRTGEALRIPARRVPAFKSGKALKDLIR